MAIYKVSFVVMGIKHPGAIINLSHRPEIGEHVQLGNDIFEITEVFDLIPSRGNFFYIHASCKLVSQSPQTENK